MEALFFLAVVIVILFAIPYIPTSKKKKTPTGGNPIPTPATPGVPLFQRLPKFSTAWLWWIAAILLYIGAVWWIRSYNLWPPYTYLLAAVAVFLSYAILHPIVTSFGDSKEKRYQDIKQMLLILLGVLAVILVGAMAWSALKPHMAESNTGVVILDEPVYIPDSEDFILIETGKSVYVTLNPGQRSKRVLVSKRSFLASYLNVPTDTRVDQIAYDQGKARTHQATAGVDNDVGSCEWVVFVNKSAIRFTMQIYIP